MCRYIYFSEWWVHKLASSYTDTRRGKLKLWKKNTCKCRTCIWNYAHWPRIPLSKCDELFSNIQQQTKYCSRIINWRKDLNTLDGRLWEIHVLKCWTRQARPLNCFLLGKMYVHKIGAKPSTFSIKMCLWNQTACLGVWMDKSCLCTWNMSNIYVKYIRFPQNNVEVCRDLRSPLKERVVR